MLSAKNSDEGFRSKLETCYNYLVNNKPLKSTIKIGLNYIPLVGPIFAEVFSLSTDNTEKKYKDLVQIVGNLKKLSNEQIEKILQDISENKNEIISIQNYLWELSSCTSKGLDLIQKIDVEGKKKDLELEIDAVKLELRVYKIENKIRKIIIETKNEFRKELDDVKEQLDNTLLNESGLERLEIKNLTKEKAEKEYNKWLNGYPLNFTSIFHDKDFPRKQIIQNTKTSLKKYGKSVLSGESGTSKSTIWMRILCDFLKKDYFVLYNRGNKLDYKKAKQYLLSIKNQKIIIGVDNAQTEHNAGIYNLLYDDDLIDMGIIFLLTIREPDYHRLFKFDDDFKKLDPLTKESILLFEKDKEVEGRKFVEKVSTLTKDEVSSFFTYYDKRPPDDLNNFYENTKGHPLLVRFYITGTGLENHIINRHNEFVGINSDRLQAMLTVSLLEIGSAPISDEIIKQLGFDSEIHWLEQAMLDKREDRWYTIHSLWALTWIHYILNNKDTYLKNLIFDTFRQVLQKLSTIQNITLKLNGEVVTDFEFENNRIYLPKNFAVKPDESLHAYFNKDLLAVALKSLFSISTQTISFYGKQEPVFSLDFLINEVGIEKYFEQFSDEYQSVLYADEGKAYESQFEQHISDNTKTISSMDMATKCYDRSISLDNTNASAWNNKGVILEKHGDYPNAINCFNKALALDTKINSSVKSNLYQTHLNIINRKRGDYDADGLVMSCDTAIEIDRERFEAWWEKGQALVKLGRFYESLECFEKASKLNSDNPWIWNDMGEILSIMKKHDEAIECFETAEKCEPAIYGDWDKNKEAALDAKNGYLTSLKHYDKIIDANPSHLFSWINKGNFLFYKQEYKKALPCYEKAIVIDPTSRDTLEKMGKCYMKIYNYSKAIDCFEKLIKVEPEEFEWTIQKGIAHRGLSQTTESLECFDLVIEKGKLLRALHQKGITLLFAKQFDKAIDCFEKILNSDLGDLKSWLDIALTSHIKSEQTKNNLYKFDLYLCNSLSFYCNQKYEELLKFFDKIILKKKDNYALWFYKGIVYAQMNWYTKSINCFNESLKICSNHEEVWISKILVLFKMRQNSDAVKSVAEAYINQNDFKSKNYLDRVIKLGSAFNSNTTTNVSKDVIIDMAKTFVNAEYSEKIKQILSQN